MNRTTTVRRCLLAGTVVSTLLFAAACGSAASVNHDGTTPSTTAGPILSTATGLAYNDADVAFTQMMIPHHQQAVQMATLAETRAADPEVKQLAGKIKAAQTPEISTMTGWMTGWGMSAAPADGHSMPGMSGNSMPGMMSDTEMAQLSAATGTGFDRMFARMMIAHHNGAIQNARDEQSAGANTDAKALAASIVATQTIEVATLQKILDRL